MKRSPLKRYTPLRSNPRSIDPVVLAMLQTRSNGRCELCGRIRPTDAHHRKMRSQGGPDALWNLIAACRDCHRYVHDHPEESYRKGWLVQSFDDPRKIRWA